MLNIDARSEAEWLQRLPRHDEQALTYFMRAYYAALYNYAARFTKDDAVIKDAIQEVFISLWQRRETAGSILSPKYYLLRAVKNKVLKSLHHAQRKADLSEYEFFEDYSIDMLNISDNQSLTLRKILSQLSPRQHELIYLKFYQHLDHGQIAELMSINRQSVYNLLHETIQKLRTLWQVELLTK